MLSLHLIDEAKVVARLPDLQSVVGGAVQVVLDMEYGVWGMGYRSMGYRSMGIGIWGIGV